MFQGTAGSPVMPLKIRKGGRKCTHGNSKTSKFYELKGHPFKVENDIQLEE